MERSRGDAGAEDDGHPIFAGLGRAMPEQPAVIGHHGGGADQERAGLREQRRDHADFAGPRTDAAAGSAASAQPAQDGSRGRWRAEIGPAADEPRGWDEAAAALVID